MDYQVLDLLGDPVEYHAPRRGRPPHVVTDEKRRLVIQLCAFDWSIEKIAAALSITPPTLRKNYLAQLKCKAEARFRVEAKLLGALMTEVEKGNVSAIDRYLKRLDRHDLAIMGAQRPARAPKLGKKEQANRDARLPPQGWGELLPETGPEGRLN